MNRILEKVWPILEIRQGPTHKYFIYWRGLFIKRNKSGLLYNYFWDGKDLIEILENIRATLKICRGLCMIISYIGGTYS